MTTTPPTAWPPDGWREILDGVTTRGSPAEILWRDGERERRESDDWRASIRAQSITIKEFRA